MMHKTTQAVNGKMIGPKVYPELIGEQPFQFGSLGHLLAPLNDREKIVIAMHLIFGMSLTEISRQLARSPWSCYWKKPVNGRRNPNAISKSAVCKILREARGKVFWHESFQPRGGRDQPGERS